MVDSKDTATDKRVVTGLFRDRASAECAYNAVTSRGYDKDDVDVVMSNETRDRDYGSATGETELGSKALEGTGTGAAIGGTVGAVLAAIAAIGTSVVLPGLGLVVAGPLAAALVGAGAGGLAGGLLGALVGSGIPEEHAAAYESGVKTGGTLLRVRPRTDDDALFFSQQWRACGGEQVYTNVSGGATAPTAAIATQTRAVTEGEIAIPIVEEELVVGTREVERGGVRIETHVEDRPVEETVTLREERINVERRPVNEPVAAAGTEAFKEGVIEVPLKVEEAVVDKQARVVEEIVVNKETVAREETIRDTVRRTDVEVEELPSERSRGRGNSAA